ncbi:MAG: FtsW/RodA/SpoVE family cell cycle protein [bacterium]
MESKTPKFDSPLVVTVTILLVLGVVMVYSASSFKAQETYGDSHYFLKHHLYRVGVGFVLMLIVAQINYRTWLNFSPVFLLLCLLALSFTLVSDSVPVIRGSRRWITIGFLTFQPSDFARLALILFLSLSLGAANFVTRKSVQSFLFHLAVVGCVVVPVIAQPDIGSALLIGFISLTIIFIAGERLRHLLWLGLTTAPFFLLFILRDGYQKIRIMKFIRSFKGESLDWQPLQAFIALGNGSVWGLGLGGSRQKYHFLPDPFTDFIFAIVGEEMGFVGTLLVLILFIVLIYSGFKIAMQAPDFQGKILGLGMITNIALYACASMAVVVNFLPTTGIPLPFLSYGGSALVVNLFGVGVLLNIAEQSRQEHLLRPGGYQQRRVARHHG